MQKGKFFEKRNYNAVKLSTEAKTKGLRKVVNLFLKDEIDFGVIYEQDSTRT